MSPTQRQQKGVAVVTVLLVIALATIIIASMVSQQQLDIHREQNESFIQQARSLGISGERFAAAVLFRDVKDASPVNVDSLEDDWAQTLPPVPIDNAAIEGCVVDMQGKFNLNNLVDDAGAVVPLELERFDRLLTTLNIDRTKSQAVVDWIDADVNPMTPDGAEDDYYSGLENPYGTPNSRMVSVSELQLVKGFSPAIEEERADYELLLPHISVLPRPTPLNVNTATPELIDSLSDQLSGLGADLSRWDTTAYLDYPECQNLFDLEAEEVSGALVENRDLTPYELKEEFVTASGLADEDLAPIESLFDVKSQYFQVRIDITTEAVKLVQYTLLAREPDGRTKVIYRSRDVL